MNASTRRFRQRFGTEIIQLTIAALCLALPLTSTALAAPKPFTAGSLSEILSAREGRPLIVVLWSVDCAACLKDMTLLSKTLSEHPQLDVVMISTDDASVGDQAQSILEGRGLSRLESWIFTRGNDPRLRYEIDPTWFGELPRTYFYTADHQRVAISGVLEQKHFDAWLKTIE